MAYIATQPLLIDSPILVDTDAPPSSQILLYYALAAVGGGTDWPGASLFRSTDLSSFGLLGSSIAGVTWGVALNALPSPSRLWVWDTENQITVNVINGAGGLVGTSDANVLNGDNLGALIGADGTVELVQWANALVIGNTAKLTRLLRGVRGTDYAFGRHAAGDRFVVLDGAQKRAALPLADVGLTRWYRAVTSGGNSTSSSIVPKVMTGASARPYAPVMVNAVFDVSNNLIITWLRQTRVGGDSDWLDGVTDVPLSEATESYEVDILAVNGSVKRTIKKLALPTAVYPRTAQVKDFGTPPSTFTVVVYQMSATVSRGFGRVATVPFAWPPALAASYSAPTLGGSVTLDASKSSFFRVTLQADVTNLTVTTGSDQQQITIMWAQDSTGLHGVTFPSNVDGGTEPTVTPNSVTAQSFVYDAATDVWYSISAGGGGGTGTVWFEGSGAPVGLHDDGDFYLNIANGDVYEQVSGAWGSPIGNISGADGADGAKWYTGSGAPGGLHNNGDFYFNSANGDVYEQVTGSWSLQFNITGPQGNPGITVGTTPPVSPYVGELWVDTN